MWVPSLLLLWLCADIAFLVWVMRTHKGIAQTPDERV